MKNSRIPGLFQKVHCRPKFCYFPEDSTGFLKFPNIQNLGKSLENLGKSGILEKVWNLGKSGNLAKIPKVLEDFQTFQFLPYFKRFTPGPYTNQKMGICQLKLKTSIQN